MEPVLFAHAAAIDGLTILNRTAFEDFEENGDGVDRDGARSRYRHDVSRFTPTIIVGCDGARSAVRKQIDATLQGTPVIQRVQSTYIRAPQLLELMGEPAWMTLSLNPRRCGTVVAIDGRETWLVHNHLNREDETFESVDRDGSIRAILGVGPEFEYEILSQEDWVGRTAGRRPVSQRTRLHLRRCSASVDALRRLRHECRHRRRDQPRLAAGRLPARLGRSRDPERV